MPGATCWPTCTSPPRHASGERRANLGAEKRERGISHLLGRGFHERARVDRRAVHVRHACAIRGVLRIERGFGRGHRVAGMANVFLGDTAVGGQAEPPLQVVPRAGKVGLAQPDLRAFARGVRICCAVLAHRVREPVDRGIKGHAQVGLVDFDERRARVHAVGVLR
jgi:hypothetical protein